MAVCVGAVLGTKLGTILVVDDVETVLSVTRRLLERLGWEVVTASSGEQAVARCQALQHLNAVLLDGTLLDLTGEETLARIRNISPGVPVVIMTGGDTDETRQRFRGRGVADVLQKPFRPMSIESALAPFSTSRAAS
jgi:two-component system cell cycle sensor histidine kinase/response regulator CckA